MKKLNNATEEERTELFINIAERDGKCICLSFVPMIPQNPNGRLTLEPHPRCPHHREKES